MPPANSPNREPTPFTSALRGLESPVHDDVLNLAATLTTHGDGEGDGDYNGDYNGDFDMDGEMDLQAQQARDQQQLEASRRRLRQLERARDELNRLQYRSSLSSLSSVSGLLPAAQYGEQYGEHIPEQNSMHDWAPLPSVRRHPRFTARTREYLQRYHRDWERERNETVAPQQQQPSPPAREASQPLVREARETREARDREARETPVAPMLEHTVDYLARIRHASSVDESLHCALDAGLLTSDYACLHHADFLTDTRTIPHPRQTSWLAPGAVLSGYQHATTSALTPTPPLQPNPAAAHLPPPSRPWLSTSYSTPRSLTSYLSPAAPSRPDQPSHPDPPPPPPPPPSLPPHQDRWPVKVTIHAVDWSQMSLSATMEAYNVPSHPHSHALAPNPVPATYTRTSSITTYLEGEILDFTTHTLLTESFKSSPANDALYWRKLPPFRDLSDKEVGRALTSRRWWADAGREWVFMRWKERCFVKSLRGGKVPLPDIDPTISTASEQDTERENEYFTYDSHTLARHAPPPQTQTQISHDTDHAAFDDSGCGLTISGFYYVCLRRADGAVQGLYYDPLSSPYQCLVLGSRGRGRFGSWAFA